MPVKVTGIAVFRPAGGCAGLEFGDHLSLYRQFELHTREVVESVSTCVLNEVGPAPRLGGPSFAANKPGKSRKPSAPAPRFKRPGHREQQNVLASLKHGYSARLPAERGVCCSGS
jgi:hypothetical protein